MAKYQFWATQNRIIYSMLMITGIQDNEQMSQFIYTEIV